MQWTRLRALSISLSRLCIEKSFKCFWIFIYYHHRDCSHSTTPLRVVSAFCENIKLNSLKNVLSLSSQVFPRGLSQFISIWVNPCYFHKESNQNMKNILPNDSFILIPGAPLSFFFAATHTNILNYVILNYFPDTHHTLYNLWSTRKFSENKNIILRL